MKYDADAVLGQDWAGKVDVNVPYEWDPAAASEGAGILDSGRRDRDLDRDAGQHPRSGVHRVSATAGRRGARLDGTIQPRLERLQSTTGRTGTTMVSTGDQRVLVAEDRLATVKAAGARSDGRPARLRVGPPTARHHRSRPRRGDGAHAARSHARLRPHGRVLHGSDQSGCVHADPVSDTMGHASAARRRLCCWQGLASACGACAAEPSPISPGSP